MSQNTSSCRVQTQKRQDVFVVSPEDQPDCHHCQNTFQTVSQQSQSPCFLTHCAQRIRCTCISTPMFPDIHMIRSAIQIGSLKQSKQISNHHTDHSYQNHFFSPLSLTINFSGVPPKPKASRIRFSKYLVYEKCISSLSFTKITNVGGRTATCVI